jgi:hypothetical protein
MSDIIHCLGYTYGNRLPSEGNVSPLSLACYKELGARQYAGRYPLSGLHVWE